MNAVGNECPNHRHHEHDDNGRKSKNASAASNISRKGAIANCDQSSIASESYLLPPRANVRDFTEYGTVIGELNGFNYSDGDQVDHAILRIGQK